MLGNIATTLFAGDEECEQSRLVLENTVQEFNSALSHFGHNVSFETFERLKGKYDDVLFQFSHNFRYPNRSGFNEGYS
jgi:hypothetical protein